jgi:hypothetical protein
MRTATRPTTLLTAAVLAGCLTSAGCIPGLTWTPDSRGFYFTAGKDYQKLLFFDVKAKKARTVVADFQGTTHWPAVSPDGERIAVTAVVEHAGKKQYQVVVYDDAGKERRRLKPLSWGPGAKVIRTQKDQYANPVWLFWAPAGDKLLLQVYNGGAILDLKEDRFTDLGDQVLWVFGNSPVRPDGKGFLTFRSRSKQGEGDGIAFIDWQGRKRFFGKPDPDVKSREESGAAAAMALFPYLFPTRWQGDVATARGGDVELAVDTGKIKLGVTKAKSEHTADGRVIRQQYQFGKEGARLRVIELGAADQNNIPLRVELTPAGAAPPRVLAEKAALTTLQPSPDGKTLAVRYLTGGGDGLNGDRLLVIDARGEVLADLDALKE